MPTTQDLEDLRRLAVLQEKAGGGTVTPPPETGVPGWASDLVKYGPGFLKERAKVFGNGLLTGLANLGEGAGSISGARPVNTGTPTPQEDINKLLPPDPNRGSAEKLLDRGVGGAGGALSMPIPGVGLGTQALAGASGGLGGETARRFSTNVAPNSPKLADWADIFGSLLGGGATALALGPKQGVAAGDVRKALTGTTSAQFDQAAINAQAAKDAGAKTATAAEMFPASSGVAALADKTRASGPNNPLRIQTTERPADIQALSDEFLNRIKGNPVDPNAVANSAAGSANSLLEETKNLRGRGLSNRLNGEIIHPYDAGTLHSDLQALAGVQTRPGAGDAFRTVARAMLDQNGNPITDVQQLSLALKSLKTAAKNPNSPVFSGGAIDAVDLNHAIQTAEAGLGQYSPAFAGGMKDFKDFSQQVVTPQRQGPVGSLADRNPLIAGQTPVSRLDALLTGNSPTTVEGTARQLADPVLTGGNPTSSLDIARALAQQKLRAGSTNPGATVRGLEGSGTQQGFEALLKAGGANPQNVMAPLSVADRLQTFAQPAGLTEAPKMQAMQYLLRPFRSIDMGTTGKSIAKVNEEVGNLLKDGSPESIRKLQEISMFDPNVRRMLVGKQILPSGQEQ